MTKSTELDSVSTVLWLQQQEPLNTFTRMWYHVFLWALFSSIFVHTVALIVFAEGATIEKQISQKLCKIQESDLIAAVISFLTLRKHKFGKFFPILIVFMGVVTPVFSGSLSSAIVAYVYRASSLPMRPLYALFWGVGQTVLCASVGFTRILATL